MAMPTRPFTRVEVQTSPFEGGLVHGADVLGRLREESFETVASSMVVVPDALCGFPGLTDGLCEVDDTITVDAQRVTEAADWEHGPVFVTYREMKCLPGGPTEPLAVASLEYNETYAVERAFQEALYSNTDYVTVSDDTGGASLSPLDALARMEQYLGTIGGGVIHTTRYGATYLSNLRAVEEKNGMLVTKQGTPIIAGAGYANSSPAGVLATGKTFWMWGTSMFTLAKSPVQYSEGLNLTINEQVGLAERAWTAALDCDTSSALLVDPEA